MVSERGGGFRPLEAEAALGPHGRLGAQLQLQLNPGLDFGGTLGEEIAEGIDSLARLYPTGINAFARDLKDELQHKLAPTLSFHPRALSRALEAGVNEVLYGLRKLPGGRSLVPRKEDFWRRWQDLPEISTMAATAASWMEEDLYRWTRGLKLSDHHLLETVLRKVTCAHRGI